MSADNGVYILGTPIKNSKEKEFRVIHAQAIDNIYYNEKNDNEGNPVYILNYFGNCKILNYDDAIIEAENLEKQYSILEYGISFIDLPHPFSWYENKAITKDMLSDVNKILKILKKESNRREDEKDRIDLGIEFTKNRFPSILEDLKDYLSQEIIIKHFKSLKNDKDRIIKLKTCLIFGNVSPDHETFVIGLKALNEERFSKIKNTGYVKKIKNQIVTKNTAPIALPKNKNTKFTLDLAEYDLNVRKGIL